MASFTSQNFLNIVNIFIISKNDNFKLNTFSYFSINEDNSPGELELNNFAEISFSSSLYSVVYIVVNLDLAASDKFLIPAKLEIAITLKLFENLLISFPSLNFPVKVLQKSSFKVNFGIKLKRSLNLSKTAVDKLGKFFNITEDCFKIFSNKIPVLKTDVKSLKILLLFDSFSNNLSCRLSSAKPIHSGKYFFALSINFVNSAFKSCNIFVDFLVNSFNSFLSFFFFSLSSLL